MRPKNLIFVLSDTFRRDHLSTYGKPPWGWDIQTPALDELAAKSIVFDRFYQGSFPTGPTVQDFMTGRYCFHTTGWSPLPRGVPTIQSLLGQAGYVSMCITDCHPYFDPGANFHAGFSAFEWVRGQQGDHYRTAPVDVPLPCSPEKVRQCDALLVPHLRNTLGRRYESEWFAPRVFQAAIDWLEENHGRAEPLFLYVHAFDVHEPWDPPQHYVDRYDPGYTGENIILPRYDRCSYLSPEELRHCRALYAGEIGLVDRWLGKLLARVRQLGLDDDTLIVFTADHGFYLGDHGYIGKHTVLEPSRGWPLYDVIGHCPLLLRVPGLPAERTDVLAQHVDLLPTLMHLLELPCPANTHGADLVPALDNQTAPPRTLTVNSVTLPISDDVRAYATVTDGEYALLCAGRHAAPELYHLLTDPAQQRDVASHAPARVQDLHRRYLEFLEEIGTVEEKLALRRRLGPG